MKLKINNGFIDRREDREPIPNNCLAYFNAAQLNTYFDLRRIGWKLFFIRRPRLRKHTIAMINNDGTSVGVLEESGELSTDPLPIKLRGLGEHLPPQQNVNMSHI